LFSGEERVDGRRFSEVAWNGSSAKVGTPATSPKKGFIEKPLTNERLFSFGVTDGSQGF
jgi:hypothetical protein